MNRKTVLRQNFIEHAVKNDAELIRLLQKAANKFFKTSWPTSIPMAAIEIDFAALQSFLNDNDFSKTFPISETEFLVLLELGEMPDDITGMNPYVSVSPNSEGESVEILIIGYISKEDFSKIWDSSIKPYQSPRRNRSLANIDLVYSILKAKQQGISSKEISNMLATGKLDTYPNNEFISYNEIDKIVSAAKKNIPVNAED